MHYSIGGDDVVIAYDLNALNQTIIRKDWSTNAKPKITAENYR